VAGAVSTAADQLTRVSDYLRQKEPTDLVRDLEQFARRKPEVVFGELVSGNYFAATHARLALGRGFSADEDRVPGASPVVVISDRLWRRRFAADSSVVGKPVTLNGRPFTVIGVAAPEFTGLLFRAISSDLWAPTMMMGQLRTNQLANRDELTYRGSLVRNPRGRVSVNVEPRPASLSTSSAPCIAAARSRLIANPRPAPARPRALFRSS
jgi:hypothetical protein